MKFTSYLYKKIETQNQTGKKNWFGSIMLDQHAGSDLQLGTHANCPIGLAEFLEQTPVGSKLEIIIQRAE